MMSWLAADHDPAVFPNPDVVDVSRSPNPHLAFGVGSHRCIGLHVARVMFMVMMREVLTRIPDYVAEHEGTTYYRGNPNLYGVVTMPVTFTPGYPLGVDRPF
jgi:cytochrome P450